jgi:HAE1 family hydrophobic/amphiphilic exporter-1
VVSAQGFLQRKFKSITREKASASAELDDRPRGDVQGSPES